MRAVRIAAAACALLFAGILAVPAAAATANVFIQGSAFDPATVTINVGDFVTWTNRDAGVHTSTSATGGWDSGTISGNGGMFSRQFTSAGTFSYFCNLHSFMLGSVVVRSTATPPPPAPTAPPPTQRPTVAPPTVVPTTAPTTTAPTTSAPAATTPPSPTAALTLEVAATPSPTAAVAVVAPSAAAARPQTVADEGGPGPFLVALAGVAIVGFAGVAWLLLRRT